jgi:hypothetical protein
MRHCLHHHNSQGSHQNSHIAGIISRSQLNDPEPQAGLLTGVLLALDRDTGYSLSLDRLSAATLGRLDFADPSNVCHMLQLIISVDICVVELIALLICCNCM